MYKCCKTIISKNRKGMKYMRKYHRSSTDWWTLVHIVVVFLLTWSLLQLGLEIGHTIIIMVILIIIYEPIEQVYLIGKIFKKRERKSNSGVDILVGILGLLLALVCYLG